MKPLHKVTKPSSFIQPTPSYSFLQPSQPEPPSLVKSDTKIAHFQKFRQYATSQTYKRCAGTNFVMRKPSNKRSSGKPHAKRRLTT